MIIRKEHKIMSHARGVSDSVGGARLLNSCIRAAPTASDFFYPVHEIILCSLRINRFIIRDFIIFICKIFVILGFGCRNLACSRCPVTVSPSAGNDRRPSTLHFQFSGLLSAAPEAVIFTRWNSSAWKSFFLHSLEIHVRISKANALNSWVRK